MNTHVREQESCVSPNLTAFLEMTPALRRLLESAVEDALNFVESMTLFLDEVDGDETAEEGDPLDEDDPAEDSDPADDDDPREANGDEDEPWLGATEPLPREPQRITGSFRGLPLKEGTIDDPLDQTRWANSGTRDLEADDADSEDSDPAEANGDDAEPSLGSVSHWYQPNWACGYTGDLEADVGDEPEREDHW